MLEVLDGIEEQVNAIAETSPLMIKKNDSVSAKVVAEEVKVPSKEVTPIKL